MFDQLDQGWQGVQDWIAKELEQLGVPPQQQQQQQQQPEPQPEPEPQPPEQAPPEQAPPSGPDWPVVGGALQLGQHALDLTSRPGEAVRGTIVQAQQSLGNDLGEWGRLLNPATAGDVLARHPEIAQAGWQGLTGERRTDPTELPGMGLLSDEGPSFGPVHITPRTAVGFAGALATDPLTYATFGLGRAAEVARGLEGAAGALDVGLEGTRLPAWARVAEPAHRGVEAGWLAAGPIQGAELAGRDPETGQWDPARTAAGAAAGLALPFVPRAIGQGIRAARGAPGAAISAVEQALPEAPLAYASTGQVDYKTLGLGGLVERALRNREAGLSENQVRQDIADNVTNVPPAHVDEAVGRAMQQYPAGTSFTPDIFGGENLPTQGSVFGDTAEANRARARQEMQTAGAPGLFDVAAEPTPRSFEEWRDQGLQSGERIVDVSDQGWRLVKTAGGARVDRRGELGWELGNPQDQDRARNHFEMVASTTTSGAYEHPEDVAPAPPREPIPPGNARGAGALAEDTPLGADTKGRSWRTYQNSAGTWGLQYQDPKSGEWRMEQYGRTYPSRDAALAQFNDAWKAPETPAVAAVQPERELYPMPSSTVGRIQDEGQLRARINSVGGQRGDGIRLDLEPIDLEDDGTPSAHIQRQLEAVQNVADQEGFTAKVKWDRARKNKSVFVSFEPKEISPAAPAAKPMTTPPGRAPAQPPAPPTVPERTGQAALIPRQLPTPVHELLPRIAAGDQAARQEMATNYRSLLPAMPKNFNSYDARGVLQQFAVAQDVDGRWVPVMRQIDVATNDPATTPWQRIVDPNPPHGHMAFGSKLAARAALARWIAGVGRQWIEGYRARSIGDQGLDNAIEAERQRAVPGAALRNRTNEEIQRMLAAGEITQADIDAELARRRAIVPTPQVPVKRQPRPGVESVIRVLRNEPQPPAEPIERNEFGVPLQGAAQERVDRLSFIHGQVDSIEGDLARDGPAQAFGSRDIATLRAWLADLEPTDPFRARMEGLIEQKTAYDAERPPEYLPGDRIEGVYTGQGSGAQGGKGMFYTEATVVSGPNSDGSYTLRMKNGRQIQQRPGASWKPATKLDEGRTPVKRKPAAKKPPPQQPPSAPPSEPRQWTEAEKQHALQRGPVPSGADALIYNEGRADFNAGKLKQHTGGPYERGFDDAQSFAQQGADNLTTRAPDPDNQKQDLQFRLRVVPLEDLVASHTDDLTPTPGYPQELLQPRDRGSPVSVAQVNNMVGNFTPREWAGDFEHVNRGTPIVNDQNMVVSGNGRTITLRRIRNTNPEAWAEYQAEVRRQLADRQAEGLLTGVKDPVLVRQSLSDVSDTELAQKALRAGGGLNLSGTEKARLDVGRLSDEMIARISVGASDSFEKAMRSAANRGVIRAFIDTIPVNERADLVNTDGTLSQDGLTRFRNAILRKTYTGDAGNRLFEALTQATDPDVAVTIQGAVLANLPRMAVAEALVRNGERPAELSITGDLAAAIHVLGRLRENNLSVGDYLAQVQMGARELNPLSEQLLGVLDQLARNPRQLREFLDLYADQVINSPMSGEVALPGLEAQAITTREGLFDATLRAFRAEHPDFEPTAAGGAAPAVPPAAVQGPPEALAEPGAGTLEDTGRPAGEPGPAGPEAERDRGAEEPGAVRAPESDSEIAAAAGSPVPAAGPDEPLKPLAADEPVGIDKPPLVAREAHTRASFLEPDEIQHITRLHDTVDPRTGQSLLSSTQFVGIGKALVAMNGRAQPDTNGFLLLDGMGMGKTRQELGVAQYYAERGHPVIIITADGVLGDSETLWANRDSWTGSFRDDARALGMEANTSLLKRGETIQPGAVHLSTYKQLGLGEKEMGALNEPPFRFTPGAQKPVLIFDEAHNLKNIQAQKTVGANRLIQQAHALLYATATPFDKDGHFDYLQGTGAMEPDLFATPADMYQDLGMRRAGVNWTARDNEIVFNARLEAKMDRLTDKGLMIRREFGYTDVPIGTRELNIPEHALADLDVVDQADIEPREKKQTKRALLEQHKVPAAVRMTQEALADPDAQVVIFATQLNPHEIALKEYVIDPTTNTVAREPVKRNWRDPRTGRVIERPEDAPVIERTVPLALPSTGRAWIPGTIDLLREQLLAAGVPAEQIVEIHGGLDYEAALGKQGAADYLAYRGMDKLPPRKLNPGKNTQAMEKFQAARARVVIATVKSGGVGINLDDRAVGGRVRPRTLIMLNPEWDAASNIQATGRVWRLPTASLPKINFLRAKNAPIEDAIFRLLGQKYATLGAAVSGDMIKALGPVEMDEFMQLAGDSERIPLSWEKVTRNQVKQVMTSRGEVMPIVQRNGRNWYYTEASTGKRSVKVRQPSGREAWTAIGVLAHTPDDAARLALERTTDPHLPLDPRTVQPGMRVWDPQHQREVTIERIAAGPGRTALLDQPGVTQPGQGQVFVPSRYLMVRPGPREPGEARFVEDLRSLDTEVRAPEEAQAAAEPPPAEAPTPEVTPNIQAPPPDTTPAPPPAEAPPAAPPVAPGATPGAAPVTTPVEAAPTPGPAPVAPGEAPVAGAPTIEPGAPGGGAAPPPTPPPAAPATPTPPPPPTPPVPGSAPDLERVHAMLDRQQNPTKVPLRDRVKAWVDEAGRQVADRAQPLNRMTGRALAAVGRAVLPPEVQAELQYALLGGRAEAAKVRITQALRPIYTLLRDEGLLDQKGTPRWLNIYRKAMRDKEVANMAATPGVRKSSADINTAVQAQAVLDQLHDELGPHRYGVVERASAMVQTEMDNARQELVDAGLLSQERADLLQAEHPNYNRTVYAKFTEAGHLPETSQTASQDTNTIRRLAKDGANEDTEPAMESFIRSLAEIEYNTRRNRAANAIITTMQHDPFLGPHLERAPVKLMTGPESGGMRQPLATIVGGRYGEQEGEIHRFVDGKLEAWRIKKNAPEEVRRTFAQIESLAKNDDVPAAGLMAKIVAGLNTPLRWGATSLSIPFQARNFIRDATNLFIQEGFAGLRDIPGGIYARLANTAEYQEIMRAGGGFNSLFNVSPTNMEQAIQQSGGLLVRDSRELKDLLARAWHGKLGMVPLTESIEAGPRVAAYRAALRRRATPEEAALRYRRVTVDWNRAGAALRQMNPFILFANARTQGTLNMARVLRDNPAARYRLGGLAVAATLAWAWNHNQDGDTDVPDYIKNQSLYWVLPGASKDEAGNYQNLKYVAMPLGEWAAFTAPIRMFLDGLSGRDQSGLLESLSQELQQMAPGPLPVSDPTNFAAQMLPAPMRSIIELNTNKRLFSNTPIVPRSMENLPRQEQKQAYTSEGSIWAANLAARLGHPVSPIQLDFAMRENLGGLGTMLLGMSDQLFGKAPDTVPVVGSITAGIYRTYGGQEQTDRYNLADKLQAELENSAVEATKSLPAYQQANPQTQRQMLVAAQDELKRATQQAQGISPGAIPSQRGLPPKYQGVTGEATQQSIDAGVSAVTHFMADPLNTPVPSREQLDYWHQYHGKVDPAYSAAVKARSKDTDAARGQVAQIVNNGPPPATGSDAEALQRAAAIKVQLDSTPRYVDPRTGQATGTPQLWDRWDQWLSRYQNLPSRDPQHQWLPHPLKLQYRATAQQLLSMQNQQRLRMSLSDPDYQRLYGIGRGLSDETWQKIRSTPKYKDLPAGADAQSAARDAFLASYRKLPPRDPRRLQFRLQALKYQRQLNKAYSAVVPTDKFLEQYGTSNLDNIDEPAA